MVDRFGGVLCPHPKSSSTTVFSAEWKFWLHRAGKAGRAELGVVFVFLKMTITELSSRLWCRGA